jgi:hypothetical protein
VSPH